MSSDPILIAVTAGEPAGIGPECLLRHHQSHPDQPLIAIADQSMLEHTAVRLGLDAEIRSWTPGDSLEAGALSCLHTELATPATPGKLDARNAPYVLETIERAVDLVQGHTGRALVTGPVHKGIINDAGIAFSGHTEFLADLAGIPRVVMMLAADTLRVALVTTHLPLREVPDAITRESLSSALNITHDSLRDRFGIERPRIQVLGLNPHAGEGGHLGSEDDEIIVPVLNAARDQGMNVTGPVPADSAFTPGALASCDAVLAMYHDQGLPVLKHAGFGQAVNITLGLPFIRTSVDHGTALDIAAKGGADPSSLGVAVKQARDMLKGTAL